MAYKMRITEKCYIAALNSGLNHGDHITGSDLESLVNYDHTYQSTFGALRTDSVGYWDHQFASTTIIAMARQ